MSRVALPHPLALPGGWPRRVGAAAVHAVALADFALTTSLGWAAQSLNPRLRLRAEFERLRQEIALLREETRITGAVPVPCIGRGVLNKLAVLRVTGADKGARRDIPGRMT